MLAVLLDIGNLRYVRRSERQLNRIFINHWVEVRNRIITAVDNTTQCSIFGQSNREVNRVNLEVTSVFSGNGNNDFVIKRLTNDCIGLRFLNDELVIRIFVVVGYDRQIGCTGRQFNAILILVSLECIQRFTVNLNHIEFSDTEQLFLERNGINVLVSVMSNYFDTIETSAFVGAYDSGDNGLEFIGFFNRNILQSR